MRRGTWLIKDGKKVAAVFDKDGKARPVAKPRPPASIPKPKVKPSSAAKE